MPIYVKYCSHQNPGYHVLLLLNLKDFLDVYLVIFKITLNEPILVAMTRAFRNHPLKHLNESKKKLWSLFD